jgi:hypothetical protein
MIKMEKFDFVFILTSIPDETCGYCGVKRPGCYLEHISEVRNGKSGSCGAGKNAGKT